MRWIVITLVLINLVVLLWHLAQPEAPQQLPVQTQQAGDAPTIKLLSELEQEALETLMATQTRVIMAAPEPSRPSQPLCTLIGPFPALLRAEYFAERLGALDVEGKVSEVEIPGELSYWVFLPPQDSRKQAIAKLRELQSRGVDSYVIPKGELENGISFGMFNQQDLAKQRLAAMISQGYAAQLKEIPRSYREVWIILAPGEGKALSDETWVQLMSEEDGLERRQNYCPAAVASE